MLLFLNNCIIFYFPLILQNLFIILHFFYVFHFVFFYSTFYCLFSLMALFSGLIALFFFGTSFYSFFFTYFCECVSFFVCSCLISATFTICLGVLPIFSFLFLYICLIFFYFFLFLFCYMWIVESWCSSQGWGLNFWDGSLKFRMFDHQRTPDPMEY